MFEKLKRKINNIQPPKRKFLRVLWETYELYDEQRVPRSAAAFSYYVIIAMFPVLIIATRILAGLNVSDDQVIESIGTLIPPQVIGIMTDFLGYVRGSDSTVILVVGVGVMMTSTASAFRTVMGIFGDIEGKRRFTGILGYVFGFALSAAFMVAIFVSGVVVLTGEWLRLMLEKYLGTSGIVGNWRYIRFLIMFLIVFLVIFALYIAAAPKGDKFRRRIPGALVSSVIMVCATAVFSRMISESAKYTLVYGSLASIIILLLFLYTCGVIMILGNIVNVAIKKVYYGN